MRARQRDGIASSVVRGLTLPNLTGLRREVACLADLREARDLRTVKERGDVRQDAAPGLEPSTRGFGKRILSTATL